MPPPGSWQPAAAPPGVEAQWHPLSRSRDSERLAAYETAIKAAFDRIVPTLKAIAALQHERHFERQAQEMACAELGFGLPEQVLADAWVEQLDMRSLFAWSVFETYRLMAEEFYRDDPLGDPAAEEFERFLQDCGFHVLDLSPCADGRLAHAVRYVLRLPQAKVQRKSYAGAMFDVEESVARWVQTELGRFREGQPNTADAPTRYLKMAMYHYSGSRPEVEGCAAHGSNAHRAAEAALTRLYDFRQAIENSFCCGASIDLLLAGIDTDCDAIRIHVPDRHGNMTLGRMIEASGLYEVLRERDPRAAQQAVEERVRAQNQRDGVEAPGEGMIRLIARLLVNNLSQIDYVKHYHAGRYTDIGHQERFMGVGTGFDEVQLRNLTYFAHSRTVEEGASDLDVGIKIFSHLYVSRGLPVPVVVRFDYLGHVPGARTRAIAHCQRIDGALQSRYRDLASRGLLHTLLAVRDCSAGSNIEVVNSSVARAADGGGH